MSTARLLHRLGANLSAGLQVAFGRRPLSARFHIDADSAVLLLLFGVTLELLFDRLLAGPLADPQVGFDAYGLARQGALLLCGLLAVWLVARLSGDSRAWLRLLVLFGAVAPLFVFARAMLEWGWLRGLSVDVYELISWGLIAWFAVIALRLIAAVSGRPGPAVVGMTALLLAFGWAPHYLLAYSSVWYAAGEYAEAVPTVNVEELFYAQPQRVARALDHIEPGRPGVVDLYFVGFGGYAGQDVFMREVEHARDIMEQRFDTAGRSISLVNNPDTAEKLPIASLSNLRLVLDGLARRMDPDEDVLMLFLTSHGSRQHELAVEFWPLTLNTIHPQDLRRALDEAGISWRVLVVSACYSGGFLPALQDDRTLVMTASASDRQSFGCANENEYTYFGRALFADALQQGYSFPAAFEQARAQVEQRERKEGIKPSQPMMHLGAGIREQLWHLETRLTELYH